MSELAIFFALMIFVALMALAFGAGDKISRRGDGKKDRDLDGETDGRNDG